MMKSRKSPSTVLNLLENTVTAVSAAQNVVSISAAWYRLTFSPIACNVKQDEYSTTQLPASSWKMMTTR